MLMEIYLSEEKAKKNNIDLESCYQKINRYFLDHGVKIKSPGVYQGVKEDPEYREDALKIYYKAKSQVKEYVRKQKGA